MPHIKTIYTVMSTETFWRKMDDRDRFCGMFCMSVQRKWTTGTNFVNGGKCRDFKNIYWNV